MPQKSQAQAEKRKRKKQRGLTLVEVTVATGLTLLLFFGALDLYVTSAQLAVSTAGVCYAATDKANAVQRVVRDAEEARWLALPGENGWISPGNAPTGAFQSAGTAAAVQLVFPAADAAAVQSRSGAALRVSPPLYDRTQDAAPAGTLWVYRADSDGTPNAGAGSCLWIYGTERGHPVSRAVISSVNPADANAVQFARPQTPLGVTLPYQLQIRLVSAYFSPIQPPQASGSSPATGAVGKCVLLRDHEMNLDHEPMPTTNFGPFNASLVRSD